METMPIGDIKRYLESVRVESIPETVKIYENDERSGVQKLVMAYMKKHKAYLDELRRLDKISEIENDYYNKGYKYIAGVDEVGRGPLCGPVVTAAVILKKGAIIHGCNDSKKLSQLKREQIYEEIIDQALAFSIGIASHEEIDDINILRATYRAMKMAIDNLSIKPDYVLVDAVTIPGIRMEQKGIVGGDAKSISIAAASIVAKVTRDKMMEEYDLLYPGYGFKSNKGYGSKEHIDAIKKNGICPIHRKNFVKSICMF